MIRRNRRYTISLTMEDSRERSSSGLRRDGGGDTEDLYRYGRLDEIVVGTRSPGKAERWRGFPGEHPRDSVAVDAADEDALVRLMKGMDVVVNCIGPNYQYELPVARAAIRARTNLVDLNDEFETTEEMFDLDEEARAAGIIIVLGLGGCRGSTTSSSGRRRTSSTKSRRSTRRG